MFKVNHAEGMDCQADWLLSCFEKMQHEGVSFSHGLRIKLGWSILELQSEQGNSLVVCEPDFLRNPFVDFRPDVSVSLQVQASQVAFVNQLNLAPLETSFQDRIIFAKGCWDAKKIYMERVAPRPENGDSGWFFGVVDGNNEPGNLQSGFVFQLLKLRPMLLQLLLLPAGYMVVLDGGGVEAVLDQYGSSVEVK
ncbi:hypothetical protein [Chromobacterium sp. IIBBL 290-4]|uniref:immunity protein Imm33 domain-containing protein n=1 Tax=Chromobacterium sp. IIBBL 290-4 TaxID=2953890 RepID=UPI0020B758DB|nr:hypothetical protein [Chromobacterium sp. IIBBL 290-4]UTH73452.1 hypothetical protein NKT35_18200 [Chromobacterium sp. IIBBL 290-4]